MTTDFASKIEYLCSNEAAAVPHSSANLLAHLMGTFQLLVDWGCRDSLCDAGLFHSVYGTESYPVSTVPPSARDTIGTLIGSEAERLAFLFGIMTKRSFYSNLGSHKNYTVVSRSNGKQIDISSSEFRDLCHMVVANWLEQRPRACEESLCMRRSEFSRMRAWLSEPAWQMLNGIYEFDRR